MRTKHSLVLVMVTVGMLLGANAAFALVEGYTTPWSGVPGNGTAGGPTYAPNWWDDPTVVNAGDPNLGESDSVRVGWVTWENTTTGTGDPDADYAYMDFDPYPATYVPWQWNPQRTVVAGKGILLPATEYGEIDLFLPNRAAHIYKYFYYEATWTAANATDAAHIPGALGTPTYKWCLGGNFYDPVVTDESSAWVDNNDLSWTYWYTARLEVQPDTDIIKWTSADGFQEDIYLSEVHIGTTCSPEPGAIVLLGLSALPIVWLRRRRRED